MRAKATGRDAAEEGGGYSSLPEQDEKPLSQEEQQFIQCSLKKDQEIVKSFFFLGSLPFKNTKLENPIWTYMYVDLAF